VLLPDSSKGISHARLPTPAFDRNLPAAAGLCFRPSKSNCGRWCRNLFRLVGTSPAALEGFSALSGALAKRPGSTPRPAAHRACRRQNNGCDYCLSAAYLFGKNLRKAVWKRNGSQSRGGSTDPKAAAAVRFRTRYVRTRGTSRIADSKPSRRQVTATRRSSRIVMHRRAEHVDQLLSMWLAENRDRIFRS